MEKNGTIKDECDYIVHEPMCAMYNQISSNLTKTKVKPDEQTTQPKSEIHLNSLKCELSMKEPTKMEHDCESLKNEDEKDQFLNHENHLLINDQNRNIQIKSTKSEAPDIALPEGWHVRTITQMNNDQDVGKSIDRKGIWTEHFIPKGIIFGPFTMSARDETPEQALPDDKVTVSVPAKQVPLTYESTTSTRLCSYITRVEEHDTATQWMHNMKVSNTDEGNLIASLSGGQVFLETKSDVEANSELVMDQCIMCTDIAVVHPRLHDNTKDPKMLTSESTQVIQEISDAHTENAGSDKPAPQRKGSSKVSTTMTHTSVSSVRSATNCSACGFTSSGLNCWKDLAKHMHDSHPKQMLFECNSCDACFTEISGISAHIDWHRKRNPDIDVCVRHTGGKPHKCDMCSASFIRERDLTKHKISHTGEKLYKYKCDVCSVGFIREGDLMKHKLIHTQKKPYHAYTCGVCGASFARMSGLTKHRHAEQESYKCVVCGASFTSKSNLVKHTLTHTGKRRYKCYVCDVGFNRKCDLANHMVSHTKEKPYKCDVCDAGFKRKYGLTKHKLTHTNEKLYKCATCDAGFNRNCDVANHMVTQMLYL